MKALQVIDGHAVWNPTELPERKAGQVRIRVAAAGLNRADLLQRSGLYPPPPGVTAILGLECAGVVIEADEGGRWKQGDRVCCLLAGGGMAEEVTVDARHVLPVPEGLSLPEAAALPEVYATAWLNLFELARLAPGEKVLLHAGASGVGSAAIQLCKAFGSPCWVSVGSKERLAYCLELGASGGVIRQENLQQLDEFAPFDVILDPVGAAYAQQNLRWLGYDGRWVNIGLMGGRKAEMDLALLLGKRLQLIGSTLRSRSVDAKAALLASLQRHVWSLFESGQLSPQLAVQYPIEQAEEAFAVLAGNQVNGKLVLIIDPELR